MVDEAAPSGSVLPVLSDEEPEHAPAVAALLVRCFDGEAEARLVERLRRDGDVIAALVASIGGEVVGHVLFSALTLELDTGGAPRAAALAPLAVHPTAQRRGIGTALVLSGLEDCGEQGIEAVFVLGDPAYYGRFGFSAPLARSFDAPWTGQAFQALELVPGALERRSGRVVYPNAFGGR